MNKLAKSSIAGAAGVILLMGGAGTLAYWNGSAALGTSGQTVNSGQLSVTANNDGAWTASYNGGTAAAVPTGFKAVPGDQLVYKQTFVINATGNDLLFTVGATPGVLQGSATPTAAQTALIGALTNAATYTVAGSNITQTGTAGNNTYKVTGTGSTTVTVTETINWAWGTAPASNTTGDNAAQNASLTLTNGAVTLTQVQTAS